MHTTGALSLLVQLSIIVSDLHLASAFQSSFLLHSAPKSAQFLTQQIIQGKQSSNKKRVPLHANHATTTTEEWPPSVQRHTHTFQGRECAYLHVEATSEAGAARPPLLLLHPVGIGISSWFWQRFVVSWAAHSHGGSAVVVPDLLGCGASPWSTSKGQATAEGTNQANKSIEKLVSGLMMPDVYVAQCEALLDALAIAEANGSDRADHTSWAVLVQVLNSLIRPLAVLFQLIIMINESSARNALFCS
jgi:hypothetical protein